jgi:hypothetical protein
VQEASRECLVPWVSRRLRWMGAKANRAELCTWYGAITTTAMSDVFSVSSTDHGRTWSKPVRVNTDAIHNGIDQFFQWLAVDPITGDVYVQFYDRRDDPANRKTGFTLARSTDEGKTFMNYTWAESPFESQQPAFLGDYTWLTAYNHKVYGAWTEALPTAEAPANAEHRRGPGTAVRVGLADFSDTR